MGAVICAEDITKDYGREQILKGITLSLYRETFTALLGPSGSGKTTLIHILAGLLKPSSGTVLHGGQIVSGLTERQLARWRREHVGIVFQEHLLLDELTAGENIHVGICPGRTPLSFDRLVRTLDLDGILDKFPAQLSGGQKQRVAIARAVIKGPALLFCDEATGALDGENSKKVVGLLHELKRTYGVTILFSTHNAQIAHTADRVLTIKDGTLSHDHVNTSPISADEMAWEMALEDRYEKGSL